MKRFITTIMILSLVLTANSSANDSKKNGLLKTTVNFANRIKQGYQMRVWLSNQMKMGIRAWDGGSSEDVPDGIGLEYPAGTQIEHLYGGGPRIAGKIDGVPHVDEGYNGNDTRSELLPEYKHLPREIFWQTSVNNVGEPNIRGCDDDHDGKIDEDELDGTDNDGDWNPVTDDVGGDGLADPSEVSCDGKPYDPVYNPDPAGDDFDPAKKDKCHPRADGTLPFKSNPDIYFEKNGMPDHGEPHVDEDYGAISHNDLYCAATDTFSRPTISGHYPMGIKVIQKSYAWSGVPEIEAVLPFDYWFINMGQKTITDVYVGFFADVDIGPIAVDQYYENNYSAYMDSLRTAYVHNPVNRGSTPFGVTVLKTPKPLDSLDFIYQWSDFSTRPDPGTNDSAIYSWMSGEAFPNQHIAPNQSETNLSDTRFLFSFGKFDEFKPGDTLKISISLISGYSISSGAGNLKENAENAIKLFNRGYVTPTALVSPLLKDSLIGTSVKLTWSPHVAYNGILGGPYNVWDDSNKYVQEHYDSTHWRRIDPPCSISDSCSLSSGHKCIDGKLTGGRTFSGFRLYRSEDVGNSPDFSKFTLLREYSIPDTASLWSIEHMDSTFVDSFLVRGKRYWYSVTAYGLPDIVVIPVATDNGVRYDTLRSKNSESAHTQNYMAIDVPFDVSHKKGDVLVVPNPYRVDQDYTYESGGWEGLASNWDETKRIIKFIHLPKGEWMLRIFTMAGEQITKIENSLSSGYTVGGRYIEGYKDDRGEISWDLMSENRRALASGVYVFSIESAFGTQIDKFVLIR